MQMPVIVDEEPRPYAAPRPAIANVRPFPAERLRGGLAFVLLLAASVLFRLPALINASGVNSDAAIVGLQARHILHGEWSWFLWGAGYQGSLDALLIAIGFAVAGATPLVLMAVPLIGHLLLTWFVFDVLRKRTNLWVAMVGTLPIVFAPRAINGVVLYAPRQWCITTVFAAIWLFDGARESRWSSLRYAIAGLLGVLSLYLDLYALQFMIGLGAFACACCLDGSPRRDDVLKRVSATTLGFGAGLLLVWLSRRSPIATTSQTTLALDRIPANFKLLWNTCLPWLLGYKVFLPGTSLIPGQWHPPVVFQVVQIVGAELFVLGLLFGGLAMFLRRIPWAVRRLGLLGCIVAVSSIAGFLVSRMPVDLFSARYLAPIVWIAPFAFAPAAYLLGSSRFVLALAPYAAAAAVGGWLGFGPYVHGPLPVLEAHGVARDESQLGAVLRAHDVKYAAAQYWLSYRFSFLWAEDPVVMPIDPREDRYAPYRNAFDRAPVVAFIFDPFWIQAKPEPYENWLKQAKARYERIKVADYTVLILHKEPCTSSSPPGPMGYRLCLPRTAPG